MTEIKVKLGIDGEDFEKGISSAAEKTEGLYKTLNSAQELLNMQKQNGNGDDTSGYLASVEYATGSMLALRNLFTELPTILSSAGTSMKTALDNPIQNLISSMTHLETITNRLNDKDNGGIKNIRRMSIDQVNEMVSLSAQMRANIERVREIQKLGDSYSGTRYTSATSNQRKGIDLLAEQTKNTIYAKTQGAHTFNNATTLVAEDANFRRGVSKTLNLKEDELQDEDYKAIARVSLGRRYSPLDYSADIQKHESKKAYVRKKQNYGMIDDIPEMFVGAFNEHGGRIYNQDKTIMRLSDYYSDGKEKSFIPKRLYSSMRKAIESDDTNILTSLAEQAGMVTNKYDLMKNLQNQIAETKNRISVLNTMDQKDRKKQHPDELRKLQEKLPSIQKELDDVSALDDGYRIWRDNATFGQATKFGSLLSQRLYKERKGSVMFEKNPYESSKMNQRVNNLLNLQHLMAANLGHDYLAFNPADDIDSLTTENNRFVIPTKNNEARRIKTVGALPQYVVPRTEFDLKTGNLITRTDDDMKAPKFVHGGNRFKTTNETKAVIQARSLFTDLLGIDPNEDGSVSKREVRGLNGDLVETPVVIKVNSANLRKRKTSVGDDGRIYTEMDEEIDPEKKYMFDKLTGNESIAYNGVNYSYAFSNGDEYYLVPTEIKKAIQKRYSDAGAPDPFDFYNYGGLYDESGARYSGDKISKQINNIRKMNSPSIPLSEITHNPNTPNYAIANWSAMYKLLGVTDKPDQLDSIAYIDKSIAPFDFQGRFGPLKFMAHRQNIRQNILNALGDSATGNMIHRDANGDIDEAWVPGIAINEEFDEGSYDEQIWKQLEDFYAGRNEFNPSVADNSKNIEAFKQRYLTNVLAKNLGAVFLDTSVKSAEGLKAMTAKEYLKKYGEAELEQAKKEGRAYGDMIRLTQPQAMDVMKSIDKASEGKALRAMKSDEEFSTDSKMLSQSAAESLNLPPSFYEMSAKNYEKYFQNMKDPTYLRNVFFKGNVAATKKIEEDPFWIYSDEAKKQVASAVEEKKDAQRNQALMLDTNVALAVAASLPGIEWDPVAKLAKGNGSDIGTNPLSPASLEKYFTGQVDKNRAELDEMLGITNTNISDEGRFATIDNILENNPNNLDDAAIEKINLLRKQITLDKEKVVGLKTGQYYINPSEKTTHSISGRFPAAIGTAAAIVNLAYDAGLNLDDNIKKSYKQAGLTNDASLVSPALLYKMNTGDFDGDTIWSILMNDDVSYDEAFNNVRGIDERIQEAEARLNKKKQAIGETKNPKAKAPNTLSEARQNVSVNYRNAQNAMGVGSALLRDALQMDDSPQKWDMILSAIEYYDQATSKTLNEGKTLQMNDLQKELIFGGRNFNRLVGSISDFNTMEPDEQKNIDTDRFSVFKTNLASMHDANTMGSILIGQRMEDRGLSFQTMYEPLLDELYGADNNPLREAAEWYMRVYSNELYGRKMWDEDDNLEGSRHLLALDAYAGSLKDENAAAFVRSEAESLRRRIKFANSETSASRKNMQKYIDENPDDATSRMYKKILEGQDLDAISAPFDINDEKNRDRRIRMENMKRNIRLNIAQENTSKIYDAVKNTRPTANVTSVEPWMFEGGISTIPEMKGTEYVFDMKKGNEGSSAFISANENASLATNFFNQQHQKERMLADLKGRENLTPDILVGNIMHKAFEETFETLQSNGPVYLKDFLFKRGNTPGLMDVVSENFKTIFENGYTDDKANRVDTQKEFDKLGFELLKQDSGGFLLKAKDATKAGEAIRINEKLNNMFSSQYNTGSLGFFMSLLSGDDISATGIKMPFEGKTRIVGMEGKLWGSEDDSGEKHLGVMNNKGQYHLIEEGKNDSVKIIAGKGTKDEKEYTTHAKPDLVLAEDYVDENGDKKTRYWIADYKSSQHGSKQSLVQSSIYARMYEDMAVRAWEGEKNLGAYKDLITPILDENGNFQYENGRLRYNSSFAGAIGLNAGGGKEINGRGAAQVLRFDGNNAGISDTLYDAYVKALETKGKDYADGMLLATPEYAKELGLYEDYMMERQKIDEGKKAAKKAIETVDNGDISRGEAAILGAKYKQDQETLAGLSSDINKEYRNQTNKIDPALGFDRFEIWKDQLKKTLDRDAVKGIFMEAGIDSSFVSDMVEEDFINKEGLLNKLRDAQFIAAIEDPKSTTRALKTAMRETKEDDSFDAYNKMLRRVRSAELTREGLKEEAYYDKDKGWLTEAVYTDSMSAEQKKVEANRATAASEAKKRYEDAQTEIDEMTSTFNAWSDKYISSDHDSSMDELKNMSQKMTQKNNPYEKIDEYYNKQIESIKDYIKARQENIEQWETDLSNTNDPAQAAFFKEKIANAKEQIAQANNNIGDSNRNRATDLKEKILGTKKYESDYDAILNSVTSDLRHSPRIEELRTKAKTQPLTVAELNELMEASEFDASVLNDGKNAVSIQKEFDAKRASVGKAAELAALQGRGLSQKERRDLEEYNYFKRLTEDEYFEANHPGEKRDVETIKRLVGQHMSAYDEDIANSEALRSARIEENNRYALEQQRYQYDRYNTQRRQRNIRGTLARNIVDVQNRRAELLNQASGYQHSINIARQDENNLKQQIASTTDENVKADKTKELGIKQEEIANLTQEMNAANAEAEKFSGVIGGLNAVGTSAAQTFSNLASQLGRRLFQKAIQETKNFVKQFDSSMNEIQTITMKNDVEMLGIRSQTVNKAIGLRTSVSNVANVETSLYRQGLSDQEVSTRTDAIIKFATVAKLKTEEATKIITTALKNDLVASAEEAMDTLVALGDNAATAAAEIGKGMQKAAASAKVADVSYSELTALLTIGTESTQLSGTQIGTSLQTVFSRMRRLSLSGYASDKNGEKTTSSDAEAALKAVGVDLWDNKNIGKMRSAYDILSDLSKVWNDLSDAQKNIVMNSLAGTRQTNVFSTLMEGMAEDGGATLDKYLGLAEDSSGITQSKYEIAMQSIEASMAEFKSSFDSIVESFTNNGLITGFIDGLSSVMQTIATIGQTDGGKIGVVFSAITAGIAGMAAACLAAKTAVAPIASLLGLLAGGAIAATGIGITNLFTTEDAQTKFNRETEEQRSAKNAIANSNANVSSKNENLIKETKDLGNQFEELKKKGDDTSDIGEKLTISLGKLGDAFPEISQNVKNAITDLANWEQAVKSAEETTDNYVKNNKQLNLNKDIAFLKHTSQTEYEYELAKIVSDEEKNIAGQTWRDEFNLLAEESAKGSYNIGELSAHDKAAALQRMYKDNKTFAKAADAYLLRLGADDIRTSLSTVDNVFEDNESGMQELYAQYLPGIIDSINGNGSSELYDQVQTTLEDSEFDKLLDAENQTLKGTTYGEQAKAVRQMYSRSVEGSRLKKFIEDRINPLTDDNKKVATVYQELMKLFATDEDNSTYNAQVSQASRAYAASMPDNVRLTEYASDKYSEEFLRKMIVNGIANELNSKPDEYFDDDNHLITESVADYINNVVNSWITGGDTAIENYVNENAKDEDWEYSIGDYKTNTLEAAIDYADRNNLNHQNILNKNGNSAIQSARNAANAAVLTANENKTNQLLSEFVDRAKSAGTMEELEQMYTNKDLGAEFANVLNQNSELLSAYNLVRNGQINYSNFVGLAKNAKPGRTSRVTSAQTVLDLLEGANGQQFAEDLRTDAIYSSVYENFKSIIGDSADAVISAIEDGIKNPDAMKELNKAIVTQRIKEAMQFDQYYDDALSYATTALTGTDLQRNEQNATELSGIQSYWNYAAAMNRIMSGTAKSVDYDTVTGFDKTLDVTRLKNGEYDNEYLNAAMANQRAALEAKGQAEYEALFAGAGIDIGTIDKLKETPISEEQLDDYVFGVTGFAKGTQKFEAIKSQIQQDGLSQYDYAKWKSPNFESELDRFTNNSPYEITNGKVKLKNGTELELNANAIDQAYAQQRAESDMTDVYNLALATMNDSAYQGKISKEILRRELTPEKYSKLMQDDTFRNLLDVGASSEEIENYIIDQLAGRKSNPLERYNLARKNLFEGKDFNEARSVYSASEGSTRDYYNAFLAELPQEVQDYIINGKGNINDALQAYRNFQYTSDFSSMRAEDAQRIATNKAILYYGTNNQKQSVISSYKNQQLGIQNAQNDLDNYIYGQSTSSLSSLLNMTQGEIDKTMKKEGGKGKLQEKIDEKANELINDIQNIFGIENVNSDALIAAATTIGGDVGDFLNNLASVITNADGQLKFLAKSTNQSLNDIVAGNLSKTTSKNITLNAVRSAIDVKNESNWEDLVNDNNLDWSGISETFQYMVRAKAAGSSLITDDMLNDVYAAEMNGTMLDSRSQKQLFNDIFGGDISAKNVMQRYNEMASSDTAESAALLGLLNNIDGFSELESELTNINTDASMVDKAIKQLNENFDSKSSSNLTKYNKNLEATGTALGNIKKGGADSAKGIASIRKQFNDLQDVKTMIVKTKGKNGAQLDGKTRDKVAAALETTVEEVKSMTTEELASAMKYIDLTNNETASQMVETLINNELQSLSDKGVKFDISSITVGADGSVDWSPLTAAIEANLGEAEAEAFATAMAFAGHILTYIYKVAAGGNAVDVDAEVKAGEGNGYHSGGGGGGGGGKSASEQMIEDLQRNEKLKQHQIKMIQMQGSAYKDASQLSNYNTALKEENKARQKYDAQLEKHLEKLKKQRKSVAKGSEDWKKLTDAILATEEAIAENNNTIAENTRLIQQNKIEILKLKTNLEQISLGAIEEQEKKQQSMLEGRVQMEETVLNAIKNRYQEEWELEQKGIDKKREALEEEKILLQERLDARKEAED